MLAAATLEEAYVLHARAYGDTSLLLETLVRRYGRVGLVARGARAPRSRRAGLLQPFQPLRLSWRGRGELGTLTGVESAGRPAAVHGGALASGFYLNELTLRLIARDDPHPDIYEAYETALEWLAAGRPVAPVLRRFEFELLQALGYGLVLVEDARGAPVAPERWYRVHPEAPPEPAEEGPDHVPGVALLALAAGVPDVDSARALRQLLRRALDPHLGPRALRSRELYRRNPTEPGGGDRDPGHH